MSISTIDGSQRKAARVVGWVYLLVIPLAVFAEAAATARNLTAHERLFRLGIASNLGAFALDVVRRAEASQSEPCLARGILGADRPCC
jgi:hypothetical protein